MSLVVRRRRRRGWWRRRRRKANSGINIVRQRRDRSHGFEKNT
jgi:hypothetical protein